MQSQSTDGHLALTVTVTYPIPLHSAGSISISSASWPRVPVFTVQDRQWWLPPSRPAASSQAEQRVAAQWRGAPATTATTATKWSTAWRRGGSRGQRWLVAVAQQRPVSHGPCRPRAAHAALPQPPLRRPPAGAPAAAGEVAPRGRVL